MTAKEKYLLELEDIVNDKLYIAESKNELDKEIQNNMWRISMESELAKQFSLEELKRWFVKVIENRTEQVKSNGKSKNGILFYLWFDWMASQLRFNLISELHEKLPFGCELEILSVMDPILNDFLSYPYHNGLELKEKANNETDDEANKPLKVFIYRIRKK